MDGILKMQEQFLGLYPWMAPVGFASTSPEQKLRFSFLFTLKMQDDTMDGGDRAKHDARAEQFLGLLAV
jgi:hypothetical protein